MPTIINTQLRQRDATNFNEKLIYMETNLAGVSGLLDNNAKINIDLLPANLLGSMRKVDTIDTAQNTAALKTDIDTFITTNGGEETNCYFVVSGSAPITITVSADHTVRYEGVIKNPTDTFNLDPGDWILLNTVAEATCTWGVVNNTYPDATTAIRGVTKLLDEITEGDKDNNILALTSKGMRHYLDNVFENHHANIVKTAHINNGAVDNAKLADNAVKTAKINNGAVTNAKINNGAVDDAKLADNAVKTAKINNGAVTYAKIANVGAKSLLGNAGNSAGTVEDIDPDGLRGLIMHGGVQEETTNKTLDASHGNKLIYANKADAIDFTIPLDSSYNFPINTEIAIMKTGAGDVHIDVPNGATINGKDYTEIWEITTQFGIALLKKTDANTWVLVQGGAGGESVSQVQSDWTETNTSDPSYIHNKPILATEAKAKEGTDSTDLMTPLKTKQAVDYYAGLPIYGTLAAANNVAENYPEGKLVLVEV